MYDALKRSQICLSTIQEHIDSLHYRGQCGDQLLCNIASMKEKHIDFISHHEKLHESLAQWVEESVALFPQCTLLYQKIFMQLYSLLERPRQSNESTPILKISSVPFDPQSALNITEYDTDIHISIYNDNETLFKFPPSHLYNVKNVESTLSSIEDDYKKGCQSIYTHIDKYEILTAPNTMQEQIVIFEKIITQSIDIKISDKLDELIDHYIQSLNIITETHQQEKTNCLVYIDNLMAKMTCVSQLKDNLLRSYHYTKTQRISQVRSIF
jgi:hypothetical protein